MIPEGVADLAGLLAEIERQHHEVHDLFAAVSREAALWRPDETRWSMTGHLVHMGIVNDGYIASLEDVVSAAGQDGAQAPKSDGPYRHPWISRRFVRAMEPPVERRMKTFPSMKPEPDADPQQAVASFAEHQERLRAVMESARGLDLGKLRFGSPFFALLRLSVGAGFDLVLAHNRRHIWLMRELQRHDDFPGTTEGRGPTG